MFYEFFSSDVTLYLYKSAIRSCMKYRCHVWARVPSCCLEMLNKLQKRIYRIVGPAPSASPKPLTHRLNVVFFSIVITLLDVDLNWFNWFHLLILEVGLPVIVIDYIIFLSPFLDAISMFLSAVSFLAELDSGILCS